MQTQLKFMILTGLTLQKQKAFQVPAYREDQTAIKYQCIMYNRLLELKFQV